MRHGHLKSFKNIFKAALCYFLNFALRGPLQLGYSIVFSYCCKICHGSTIEYPPTLQNEGVLTSWADTSVECEIYFFQTSKDRVAHVYKPTSL